MDLQVLSTQRGVQSLYSKLLEETASKLLNILPKFLKCCFTSTETVGLLGTGAQDVHLDFHTAPELWAQ